MFYVDGHYEELRKHLTESNYMRANAMANRWATNGYNVTITDDYGKVKRQVRRNKNARM